MAFCVQGETGSPGYRGAIGLRGLPGEKGIDGPEGDTGAPVSLLRSRQNAFVAYSAAHLMRFYI